MTFVEWTISFTSDEPTKRVTAPLFHLVLVTATTPASAVISTLRIFNQPWHLPAATKGHSPTCLTAGGGGKVITGIAIEVPTESTSLTSVIVRHSDHKIVIPVVTDCQTKISLYDHRAAALKHIQFVVLQDNGQAPQTIVNLHKYKQEILHFIQKIIKYVIDSTRLLMIIIC